VFNLAFHFINYTFVSNQMGADNLSAVLYGKDDLRLEQRPIPTPEDHELLVKVHTVSICGSDVHYLTHGAIGPFVVNAPMVLGHETSGVVVEVGKKVKGFSVGDRVAMEPGIACGKCVQCKVGRYNLCLEVRFFATPPVHGTLTRFVAHDASYCFKLPDNVSMEEGAMLEPLNVAIHACRRANLTIGKKALICGSGTIGLMNLLTAKAMGASTVVVTDIDDGRLALAKKLGADHTLNVRGKSAKEVAELVRQLCQGTRPDVCIECTGVANAIETAIYAIQSGGVIVLVGLASDRVEIPLVEAAAREIDIRGVFRYANCYPTAMEMLATGRINLKNLTSAHFTLEQAPQAFEKAKKADVIKVFINCLT